ncbi:hypothetical protein EW145_g481 [Phellinidium pouzarii]|uniref:Uncharacterized protein n=1 Tax=Phellinidium pouzarii TaxID=167371 RepID=A0A4S4LNT1_9AGAM|nr:hypothetical protein EW145_g481 [Phellinidium pouzarii]
MASTPSTRCTSPPFCDGQQTPTQRKKPRCKKCGALMLGHKRGQCQTTSEAPESPKLFSAPMVEQANLSAQLQSLQIDTRGNEDEEEREQRTARGRSSVLPTKKSETLVSLASSEKATLDASGHPRMMTDGVAELDGKGTRASIEKWLESVPPSESTGDTHKSLSRPSVEPSLPLDLFGVLSRDSHSGKRSLANTAKPLGRTSSAIERDVFFKTLAERSKKPVASVFTVEMNDIYELEQNAKRLKFHARVIVPKFADGTTGDGWLVIGKNSSSVDEVFRQVEKDVKGGKGFVSTAVASGAAGSIMAWMYLAFS